MNITVLGSGSWGTALSILLGRKGYCVNLWSRRDSLASAIASDKENKQYLPNAKFSDNIFSTSDIDQALQNADAIVLAIPSTGVREVVLEIKDKFNSDIMLIHAGKGLESETGLRGSQIITQELGEEIGKSCVALSGPNLAVELAHDIPTATVVASCNTEKALKAQELFSTQSFRVYRNPDIIGVELGGALKNVIAIGTGISDGLGYGDNTKATVVTRGLREMMRLGSVLGAKCETFTGLSGFGDLMATCASRLSRNLRLGVMLGEGKSLEDSLTSLGQVAEGMHTCEAAYLLSKKYDVYMPITEQIHSVIFENKSPQKAVIDLMNRDYKDEI